VELPQSYIIDKFHAYSAFIYTSPTYLNGCCPVCGEGEHWGKKRRLYYLINDDYLYCHNCAESWTPYYWIREVSGMTFKEIKNELSGYDFDLKFRIFIENVEEKAFEIPTLPGECVNLKDDLQVNYFSSHPIVKKAKDYCISRRLFTAKNAPKTFYCCLNDKYHGNRLIIPFYNEKGKIESYISRKLLDADTKPKYLIKHGGKKPIFNLDKVDENYPYIFIFEGQIDCMFLKNGVAVAGTRLTEDQDYKLTQSFPFHTRVWVLDNYRFENKEVIDVIKDKMKQNQLVFMYSNEFSEFKDLNEYCTKQGQDFIDPALVLNDCFTGEKGIIRLGD
jgi:hypothetical protein